MKKDDVIGGLLLLASIFGLGAFFLFAQSTPQLAYGPREITGSTIAAVASENSQLEVLATLIEPGFVTIHRSMGGAPGPMIGVSEYIAVGKDVSVTLTLSERMETGMTYIALLHVDNGDKRFFMDDDMPVTNNGVSVRADVFGP